MRIFIAVIFMVALSATADESGELVQFQNGEVADAEDINGNFELLKKLIDESSDTSCTISTADGSTSISCPDGSSASLSSSDHSSDCTASDFEGIWSFSGPDFDDSDLAELDFYTLNPDGSARLVEFECSFNGCELLAEFSGIWGSFDSDSCSIEVSANVTSQGSAWGFVYLSASSSTLTGFVCDTRAGCVAGSLHKTKASAQGKPLPVKTIKPAVSGSP